MVVPGRKLDPSWYFEESKVKFILKVIFKITEKKIKRWKIG